MEDFWYVRTGIWTHDWYQKWAAS